MAYGHSAGKDALRYPLSERVRWRVVVRPAYAYVHQFGRFAGDTEFWRARVSEPERVKSRQGGANLRFHLVTAPDFLTFQKVMDQESGAFSWMESPDGGTVPDQSEQDLDESD